jgi:WD40 repeat protein
MPAPAESKLLRLAADAIAGAIPGCAEALRPSLNVLGGGPKDALGRFGMLIVTRWNEWLKGLSREDRQKAIEELAALSPSSADRIVGSALNRLFATTSPEDKKLAADYLTAIPTTTASVLVPDADSSGTLPTSGSFREAVLLRFLPTNAPPFPAGAELPGTPYILDQLLGSGGFGVVYKASNRLEQNAPPRAIKFCLNPDMVASLQRERELLDRLMSAGAEAQWSDRVVKLLGHNLDAPLPFLVYEFIPGGNLITRLAALRRQTGQNLRPGQVLGLVRRICEAVAFAHDRRLVHRDIKPSNILVRGNKIMLADFGIGGVVSTFAIRSSSIGKSELGDLTFTDKCNLFRGAGTPLYMSPEQRQGDAPDPRHDVYSIGVLWFQLLIGDYTRELHPGWADELVEEFDVAQKQIDIIQQCVGYFKKRPTSARELLQLLPAPTLPQLPAIRLKECGEAQVFAGHTRRVNCLMFSKDVRRLLSGSSDGTCRVWDVESGREQHALHLHALRPDAHVVLSVALSPDGRRALLGCDDRNAWLWDLANPSQPPVCLPGHLRAVNGVGFSPDGRRAVTGGSDGSIRLWHVASGREILRIDEEKEPITGVTFTPDGLFLVSCSQNGSLRMWDAETGWEAQELTNHGGWLLCVAVSPDGRLAVSGAREELGLWSLETGQKIGTFNGHGLAVMSVAFHPSGQWLLSGSMDKTVRLWDVRTHQEMHSFAGNNQAVQAVAVAPDGQFFASAGIDGLIHLWRVPPIEKRR